MNELRIVYPYKGLLLNHEKEGHVALTTVGMNLKIMLHKRQSQKPQSSR